MAGEPPPRPKGTRTRIYSIGLVLITVAIIALVVWVPVILNQEVAVPPPSPTVGPNVHVDDYATGSGWAGQFGDDPTVAVAPNGTIAVAWEGLYELAPPSTPEGSPNYTTSIFVSESYDGGQEYSTPQLVGAPNTTQAFAPSLAFAPNGTLFVAYENYSANPIGEIIVTSAATGHRFTSLTVAERQESLSEPRIFVLRDGTVILTFNLLGLVEVAASTNGGQSFPLGTEVAQGIVTGATLWDGDLITLVGLNTLAEVVTNVTTWSATFNATGAGSPILGAPGYLTMPDPYFPLNATADAISLPGPTVAAAGGLLYLFYATDNETELVVQVSTTYGASWQVASTLLRAANETFEVPVAQTGLGGKRIVLSWESTQGNFWNTYAALYDVTTGLFSGPTLVSSADGFAASVRSWHGYAMGLAIEGSAECVAVWGDGRGLNGAAGLTHIFAATLTAEF
ncbi:MAG: hypothetical protein WCB18_05590 [Thermoplasmata archaeon]